MPYFDPRIISYSFLVILLWGGFVWGYLSLLIKQDLELKETQIQSSYNTIVSGYQEFADLTVEWLLSDTETVQLLKRLNADDPVARGLLYLKWRPVFQSLNLKHVRLLQFINRQGISGLRMHAPDRNGDRVDDSRQLVRKALDQKNKVLGFEHGRVFSAYRYLYPVFDQGEFIGIVELGLSFNAIRNLLETDLLEGSAARFLLLRADVLKALSAHKEEDEDAFLNSMYIPVYDNDVFVVENHANPLYGVPEHKLPEFTQPLEAKLGRSPEIIESMLRGDYFSSFNCVSFMNCYHVNFLPVVSQAGKPIAFVVTYSPDLSLTNRVVNHFIAFMIGLVAMVVLATVLSSSRRARQQLLTINQYVGKGIYVINQSEILTYVNPAACKILGYTEEELLSTNAHEMFHRDKHTNLTPAGDCPISLVTRHGKVFHGEREFFKHKDGSLITVEVTSSPIFQYGKITSVVTVFDDIRDRISNEARLMQSDVAFDQTADGMMITDERNVITRVNAAFTRVTGYHENEVIGKTPGLLKSGRQPKGFYEEMYRSIEESGVWQGEIYNKRKNGEIYPQLLSISALVTPSGSVKNYVAVFRDISDIKEKENELNYLATHDSLTCLPNRALFMDRLSHAIRRHDRSGALLSVLFIDIDRFKQVNDSLGHEIGDQLLQQITERLNLHTRRSDTLARHGGDEFVLLLEDLRSKNTAYRIGCQLIEEIKKVFYLQNNEVYVGASIGIAFYPDDAESPDSLLRNADSAMYRAKDAGGNICRYYSQNDKKEPMELIRIESELRHALETNELVLFYQPKVSTRYEQITSAEALVRWDHPKRGVLSPGVFLPVAEAARMMPDIGYWVLNEAVRQVAAWKKEQGFYTKICINADGSQLGKADFSEQVLEVLARHKVPPSLLGIEVTETAIAEHSENAIKDLHKLSDLGVSFSIDDFGTGYSSLSRLKQLPVEALKIDTSFVREMMVNESDKAIVSATIALAHRLGLFVVAEGVETNDQLKELIKLECDSIQGFIYSRPVPADEYIKLLKNFSVDRKAVNL